MENLQEFKEKIDGKFFMFNGKEFQCKKVRIQLEKLIVTSDKRTFVLLSSELSKIEILEKSSKKLVVYRGPRNQGNKTDRKVRPTVILTAQQSQELKEKYYLKNTTTIGQKKFTEEEDSLILTVKPKDLVEIIGRKYSSICVRKNYLLYKRGERNERIGTPSIYNDEQDKYILQNKYSDCIARYPQFTISQVMSRRNYLKNIQGRAKYKASKLPHPEA